VILSGSSDDGVAGLIAIKRRGGVTIAQDPTDAVVPDLPRNAIDVVPIDYIVPTSRMGALFAELSRQPAEPQPEFVPEGLEKEAAIAELDMDVLEDDDKVGTPS